MEAVERKASDDLADQRETGSGREHVCPDEEQGQLPTAHDQAGRCGPARRALDGPGPTEPKRGLTLPGRAALRRPPRITITACLGGILVGHLRRRLVASRLSLAGRCSVYYFM
jgi:hypothetical protein